MVARLMLNLRDPKLHSHEYENGYYDESIGGLRATVLITTVGSDSRMMIGESLATHWDVER